MDGTKNNYFGPLATILRVAQGVVDPETGRQIDIGGEVANLRRICDEFRREIERLRNELKSFPSVESCREDRARGDGGCGACALCCAELQTKVDKLTYAERLSHEAIGAATQEIERLRGLLRDLLLVSQTPRPEKAGEFAFRINTIEAVRNALRGEEE